MRLIALVVAALALAATAGATTQAASVGVAGLKPLSVSGKGFRSGERVTILLTAPDRVMAQVEANGRGAFVMYFAGTVVRRCQAVTGRATGSSGSRALLRRALPKTCRRR